MAEVGCIHHLSGGFRVAVETAHAFFPFAFTSYEAYITRVWLGKALLDLESVICASTGKLWQ
jgi:hypothetical protein